MKIGILTLNGHYNYGNRLQNYALSKTMKNLNCEVETLWYDEFIFRDNNYLYCNFKNIVKYILNWKNFRIIQNKEAKYNIANSIREYNIKKFSDENLKINYNFSFSDVASDSFSYYIVGSDQVWNPYFLSKEILDRCDIFLDFARPEQRISYSASFGIRSIPKKFETIFKSGLKGIAYVSVREKAGVRIVKELTGRDVPVLVDPTMLLLSDEWRELNICPKWFNGDKYILTYFLGDTPPLLNKIAKSHNYKIFNMMDIENFDLYTSRVEEFLYLIDHAELICTDSFHACVFSILFQKPFLVVNRKQKGGIDMTSRLDTLIELYGFKDRFINFDIEDFKADKLLNMDFSDVEKVQKREIAKSMEFLKKAMNMK